MLSCDILEIQQLLIDFPPKFKQLYVASILFAYEILLQTYGFVLFYNYCLYLIKKLQTIILALMWNS